MTPLARSERKRRSLGTTRLPHSGEARIWGRPTARTSAKREEHRRVGAGRDAAYLIGQLRERSLHASAVLLNRAVGAPPPWVGALGDKIASEPALGDALTAYQREYAAREGQTRHALGALGGMVPKKTPLAALPALKSSDPREILITIAGELGGSALLGGG